MNRKTITCIILFVIACLPFSLSADPLSASFSAAPQIALKKSSDFTAKSQMGIQINTGLSYTFSDSYFVQFISRYQGFLPSRVGSDWTRERGFSSISAGLGGGLIFPDFYLFGELPSTPSVALRLLGNFSKYNYTEIYFFYLAFEIEPALQLYSFYHDRMALQAGLPLAWNYQRDLDLFISAGISFKILFSFGPKEPKI